MSLETIALIHIQEARIGEEDHLVAEPFQRLADADRIERWPESRFREECYDLLWLLRNLARSSLLGGPRHLLLCDLPSHLQTPFVSFLADHHVPGMLPRLKRCAS